MTEGPWLRRTVIGVLISVAGGAIAIYRADRDAILERLTALEIQQQETVQRQRTHEYLHRVPFFGENYGP